MYVYNERDLDRFAQKVELPADASNCWLWIGAKHSRTRGYGKFRLGGIVMNAHKASYVMMVGAVANGQVIGHQCNNERCVNPAHLKAESQSDNMKYCVRSGRHNCFGRVMHGQ